LASLGAAAFLAGGDMRVPYLEAAFAGTMTTLAAIRVPGKEKKLTIEIIGHQWWWEVRYRSDDPSRDFTTANEIRIPAGRPVKFKLKSADVIHSFWVPSLSGKTDLIPGRTNEIWLEASRPGEFRGQCAEFCGVQHALMALRVVALAHEDFESWWAEQLAPPPVEADQSDTERRGQQLFVARCGICHMVRGTLAGGKIGPDLSKLMSRDTLAANTIPNTRAGLAAWISAPQQIKPGNRMPNPELSSVELDAIRAYLLTLR
jgi:cytochrome c oxidase subunit 2